MAKNSTKNDQKQLVKCKNCHFRDTEIYQFIWTCKLKTDKKGCFDSYCDFYKKIV